MVKTKFICYIFFTCVDAKTLWSVKRLPLYYWLFSFSLFFMLFSLMWGKALAILVLCAYHLHLLTYKERLYNRNL